MLYQNTALTVELLIYSAWEETRTLNTVGLSHISLPIGLPRHGTCEATRTLNDAGLGHVPLPVGIHRLSTSAETRTPNIAAFETGASTNWATLVSGSGVSRTRYPVGLLFSGQFTTVGIASIAPHRGLEPRTRWLTATCATFAPVRNSGEKWI